MSKSDAAKPCVFSYVRFSTPEQAMGRSEARQLDECKKFADGRGLPFDDTLADRGLSGFHGTHRRKGALGQFLQRVKAGEVPRGSILAVEDVDRLGREGVWATLKETIFALVDQGVFLHFTKSRIDFGRDALGDWRLNWLISEIQRAHAESKRKSDLSRDNWARKQQQSRREGRVLTAMCPAWLRVGADGRFEVIPAAAEAVRLIFELRARGVGLGTIERTLNAGGIWTPPLKKGGGRPRKDGAPAARQETTGWRISYLKKVLVNRALLGEYQPYRCEEVEEDGKMAWVRVPAGESIADYFPRVVEPTLFHAVQRLIEENRGAGRMPNGGGGAGNKGGRQGRVKNLLAHLAKCAYCGGPMAFIDRGAKGDRWLICDAGRRGVRNPDGTLTCARHSIKYEEAENLLLDNCPLLRPEQVLPSPDEQAALCQALRQRVSGQEAELATVERQVKNLIDQIMNTDDREMRGRYEARAKELKARKAALAATKAADEKRLAESERSASSFAAWRSNLQALREQLAGGDVELRLRLRTHLREIIDRVEVFATGFARLYNPLKDGPEDDVEDWAGMVADLIWESNPDWRPDEECKAFTEYVMARRMTREGRFIRVRFKTGAKVDLVPPGSLAVGMEVVKGDETGPASWQLLRLDIDRLMAEYRAGPKRKHRKKVEAGGHTG